MATAREPCTERRPAWPVDALPPGRPDLSVPAEWWHLLVIVGPDGLEVDAVDPPPYPREQQ
jgi:hypothetical protein